MIPTLTIDSTEFTKASRQMLLETNRELSKAITARLFFLLVRFFVILPPKDPQAKRQQVRTYMNEPMDATQRVDKRTGKFVSKIRTFRRVHKIVQANRRKAGMKGLYGDEMRKASGSFLRRSIGSVGYLKSGVAKAIRILNGHFVQAGVSSKTNAKGEITRKATFTNQALVQIRREYGLEGVGNVATHRGSWAHARAAQPGFDPSAYAAINISVKPDQMGRVAAIMNPNFQQAINDETREMQRHLAAVAQAVANDHNAKLN